MSGASSSLTTSDCLDAKLAGFLVVSLLSGPCLVSDRRSNSSAQSQSLRQFKHQERLPSCCTAPPSASLCLFCPGAVLEPGKGI